MQRHTAPSKKAPLVLPYELEREIFELTALAFPGHAFNLCTLARYVQEWMDAIIYKTVVLDFPLVTVQRFLETFNSKPASFFAKNVKRLYVTSIIDFPEAQRIVSACTEATTVTCWSDRLGSKENLMECTPSRRIERLSIKLHSLWGNLPPPHRFTGSSFPNLSHLELVNPPSQCCCFQVNWEELGGLPKLTHLALGHLWHSVHLYLLPTFQMALDKYPNLRVLLLLSNEDDFIKSLDESGITRDPRVVVREEFNSPVPLVDYWEAIRQGGPDFWDSADKIVSERLQASNE